MLAQLTDFHIGSGPEAEVDAAAAIAAVVALDPAPDAVVVTGDLTEHGTAEEYAIVRELLGVLATPVHVIGGNHDDPGALRAAFPVAGESSYHWAADAGALRIIGLDSTIPGRDDGTIAPELEWLGARLEEAPERPTIVALHHSPLPTGIPVLDRLGLAGGEPEALGELLGRHPQVLRVVCGHVHLASSGVVGACPVATCPSATRIRQPLDLRAETFAVRGEPTGFALHLLIDGRLVSHVQPVRSRHFTW
ncbi:MAG: metallophosphoesterase [Solirubrobacteraceae bacterium]